jgi:hypothetical protein
MYYSKEMALNVPFNYRTGKEYRKQQGSLYYKSLYEKP